MRADRLARFDPAGAEFDVIRVPTPHSMLYDVAVDHSGAIWYSGLFAHRLGRYDPDAGTFDEYPTPTPLSSTRYIEIGPDGHVWVTLFAAGRLGRLDPATGRFDEIPLPDPHGSPYDLQVDRDGVWYTDFTRNSIAYLEPDGSGREYSIASSPWAHPTELERDAAGRTWFCENGAGKVGYVAEGVLAHPGVYRVPAAVAQRTRR